MFGYFRTPWLLVCYESFHFTASAKSEPALNLATFFALILIGCLVDGLIPVRAARLATENVPKPTRLTLSPFTRALLILLIVASRAFFELTLVKPEALAIALINSHLFIIFEFF